MDLRERFDDVEEVLRTAVEGVRNGLWTALPCEVVSYDSGKQRAVLQPLVKSVQRMPDGSQRVISLPVLQDVPVQTLGGGGVSITVPLKKGDEVLTVFSSRSVDAWDQSGGEQQQVDARTHDLSDGFAIPGFRSRPKAVQNASGDAIEIRSDDGSSSVSIKPGESVVLKQGDMLVKVTASRVDLGGESGQPVATAAGFSSKVFAVL